MDQITLFDRVNLANCAMRRAEEHLSDAERFTAEFQTVRAWTKYRCNIYKYDNRIVAYTESN
jgi:hypothetical protein